MTLNRIVHSCTRGAEFHNVRFYRGLKIRLECRAQRAEDEGNIIPDLPSVAIYLYNWASTTWVKMPVHAAAEGYMYSSTDDIGVTDGGTILYWAPVDPPATDRWYSMRRNFKWKYTNVGNLVNSQGQVRVKIVHTSLSPFSIKADLLQLMYLAAETETSANEGETQEMMQGADLNYDTVVDADDVSIFVDGFVDGRAFADMNQDDTVDVQDVAIFLDQFASGVQ